MKTIALTVAALIATSGIAAAHDTRPIDRAQEIQNQRIESARYSGELTRREYRDLQAEQARIAELERRAKADGNVTGREYSAIRQAQADASSHIQSESNDSQVSIWRRWLYRTR